MSVRYRVGSDFPRDLRLAHYANGRRLMAADLHRDQQSSLNRDRQVGRAAGYGIVEGLVVEPVNSRKQLSQAVTVSPGLAVNRLGDLIALGAEGFTINLVNDPVTLEQAGAKTPTPAGKVFSGSTIADDFDDCAGSRVPGAAGASPSVLATDDFGNCIGVAGYTAVRPAPTGVSPIAALADGVYLLAARPAIRDVSGIAQYADSGLGQCGLRWQDHGTEFRLIRLDALSAPTVFRKADNGLDHRFLSRVAAWCMEHDAGAAALSDPFNTHSPVGDDPLTQAGLEQEDVPLAVLLWRDSQIIWVDNWAVRRRVTQPDPALDWEPLISDRSAALGEARFLQFQEHLKRITFGEKQGQEEISVVSLFEWLPPVGYLPMRCLPDADNRVTLQDLNAPPQPLTGLTVNHLVAPVMAQLMAFWHLEGGIAHEAAMLLKAVLLYLDSVYAGHSTGRLVDLPSFWKPYMHRFGELSVMAQVIDPHQALRLLHESWHDSAIELDAGEPIMVYVVVDPPQLLAMASALLEQSSASPAGSHLEELRKAWESSRVREVMIKRWRHRAVSLDLATSTPLYAVFARQAPSWPLPQDVG